MDLSVPVIHTDFEIIRLAKKTLGVSEEKVVSLVIELALMLMLHPRHTKVDLEELNKGIRPGVIDELRREIPPERMEQFIDQLKKHFIRPHNE